MLNLRFRFHISFVIIHAPSLSSMLLSHPTPITAADELDVPQLNRDPTQTHQRDHPIALLVVKRSPNLPKSYHMYKCAAHCRSHCPPTWKIEKRKK